VVVHGEHFVHGNSAAADVNPGGGVIPLAAHCARMTEALPAWIPIGCLLRHNDRGLALLGSCCSLR
jgi:hypothetical protein